MSGHGSYKLLLILSIHNALQSSAGVAVLPMPVEWLPKEVYAEPVEIPAEFIPHLTPEEVSRYLENWQYKKAFQALRFLPRDTFTKPDEIRELLKHLVSGDSRGRFLRIILPCFKEFLTAEELEKLLFWANHQYLYEQYIAIIDYCDAHLAPDILREIRFGQLIAACYNEAGRIIMLELEPLKKNGRDINVCPTRQIVAAKRRRSQTVGAEVSFFKKKGHNLPLNAAVDVASVDIICALLAAGANPTTLDHESESALTLAKRKLAFIEGLEMRIDEDIEASKNWQDRESNTKYILGIGYHEDSSAITKVWLRERATAQSIVHLLEGAIAYPSLKTRNTPASHQEPYTYTLTEKPKGMLYHEEIIAILHTRKLRYKSFRDKQELERAQYNASLQGQAITLMRTLGKLSISGAKLLFFSQ